MKTNPFSKKLDAYNEGRLQTLQCPQVHGLGVLTGCLGGWAVPEDHTRSMLADEVVLVFLWHTTASRRPRVGHEVGKSQHSNRNGHCLRRGRWEVSSSEWSISVIQGALVGANQSIFI